MPAELLGVELLLGDALELDPLEDDLSLEELGEDDEPEAEPEALGVLLLGELDIEPEPEDEPEDDGDEDEPEPDDSGLLDLEPEAPVLELEPRSQP